jgi:hypothetical protein
MPYSIEGNSPMKKNRVLLVNDDDIRAAFQEGLEGRGFAMIPAASANEGHRHPDAITLVPNGYPVMQEAMTSSLLPADEILTKPFGLAQSPQVPKLGRR